nr:auxin-responsive protein IAA6-like protein isoform X3 [Lilium hybrid division I]
MEGKLLRRDDMCPQLLNLIPDEKMDWRVKDSDGGRKGYVASEPEEMKLELRLGLPGGEEHTALHSLAPLPKRLFLDTEGFPEQHTVAGYLQLQGVGKELLRTEQQSLDKKPAAAAVVAHAAPRDAAGVSSASHIRSATVPVVGWPPIRSFRKNLASSSSKPLPKSQNNESESQVKLDNCRKGFFVKINMDGIPIGRKVDLKAYDSYEKLSSTVEELFQGLLAAQSDPSTTGSQNAKEKQAFTGLLDGSGEYTLVYEDNEGDRMLVGDVPWDMFVSTAKRLRVMKSSELPALCSAAVSRKRTATEC